MALAVLGFRDSKHKFQCLEKEFDSLADVEQYAREIIKNRKEVIIYRDGLAYECYTNKDGQIKFARLKGCVSYERYQ